MSEYREMLDDATASVAEASLERVKLLLATVPGGVYKAVGSALKRAGDTARTQAAKIAAAEYTITQATFRKHVRYINHFDSSKTEVTFGFKGYVIPLIEFETKHGGDGEVSTRVKRGNAMATLNNAFIAQVYGHTGVYERKSLKRLPIEQLYGPSTAHMMYEKEETSDKLSDIAIETFDKRIEHEIARILNGYGV
ncbi:MAG: hypothetical protein RR394_02725 [Oscillospiraceae bacterium]